MFCDPFDAGGGRVPNEQLRVVPLPAHVAVGSHVPLSVKHTFVSTRTKIIMYTDQNNTYTDTADNICRGVVTLLRYSGRFNSSRCS